MLNREKKLSQSHDDKQVSGKRVFLTLLDKALSTKTHNALPTNSEDGLSQVIKSLSVSGEEKLTQSHNDKQFSGKKSVFNSFDQSTLR